jgi:hypothetical protein
MVNMMIMDKIDLFVLLLTNHKSVLRNAHIPSAMNPQAMVLREKHSAQLF